MYKPYSPSSVRSADDSPVYENAQESSHFSYGHRGGDRSTQSTTPGNYHPTPANLYERTAAGESGLGRNSNTSTLNSGAGVRNRYAPYPATSSMVQDMGSNHGGVGGTGGLGSRHGPYPSSLGSQGGESGFHGAPQPRPSADDRADLLPPIATFDLGSPRPSTGGGGASSGFALPKIGSIRDMVAKPELDASTVLRRLKLEDEQDRIYATRRSSIASSGGGSGGRGGGASQYPTQAQATGSPPASTSSTYRHRDEAYYQLYHPSSSQPVDDREAFPPPTYSPQGSSVGASTRQRGSPPQTRISYDDVEPAPPKVNAPASMKGWPGPGPAVPLYHPGYGTVAGSSQHPSRPW